MINSPIEEVIHTLTSDRDKGLSNQIIKEKQNHDGLNEIKIHKRRGVLVEFLKNFLNPLILILLLIVIISFLLGDTLNSIIVLLMVLLSVCLNFYQEHKANNAAERLQDKVALFSTVVRQGKQIDVKASDICNGDILLLNAGDLIPADARIIESKDFFVNQSSLTGEAYPVEKNDLIPQDSILEISNLSNIIFSGSSVITGTAKAIVTAIGINTEFGKIARDLTQNEQDNNFTHGVKNFSYFILRIVVVFVLFIFVVNALIKQDFFEALTFAIAVAVGLTPEFLPMIMTVTMSKGAVLMAKKGVIVKKLTAIPSFGSMNVLCTDKTGTLTEDKITLVKYIDINGNDSDFVLQMAYLNSNFQTGINNPLDNAILQFKKIDSTNYKKIDEIPFDFIRRRLSVIVQKNEDRHLISKGAPEAILTQCSRIQNGDNEVVIDKSWQEKYIKKYHSLSEEGFRVLAVAAKKVSVDTSVYTSKEENDLSFVGFVAFLDPIKQGVKDAINTLEKIGIEVKVITGDNELVTQKACKEAMIPVKGILLGSDIAHLSDRALGAKAQNITIFARFSPTEKERVIKALRLHGNVVGYMGDGINDAPSIKAADVGISVSNAVDVAKESADFILTHKSLLELKDGVIEGRIIFGNTMKYVMMGLSSNFGNMFSVLGAVIFLPFLPMIPIQILLNNFLYDISQLTIPTDNVDLEYLNEPKRWNIHFIRRFMFIFGPISSLFDFITFYVLYSSFKDAPGSFQTGWFLESLATQTLVIHIIRTRQIPFIQSHASKSLIISTISIVLLGWLLPYTRVGVIFSLVPLPIYTIMVLSVVVIGYLIMVELGKRVFYKNSHI